MMASVDVPSTSSSQPLDHTSMHGTGLGQHTRDGTISWPCQACLPFIQSILGGSSGPSIAAGGPASAPWAFSAPSPFPDYIYVPALVHRSQLAIFATTPITTPAVPNVDVDVPHFPDTASPTTETSTPSPVQRKTRGVKIACTNCRAANKKCDEGRPCGRCMKSGNADGCVTAERKPRRRTVRQTTTTTTTTTETATTTAGASITVSAMATQVAVDTPMSIVDESPTMPAASTPSSFAIGSSPYVNDSHEMADGASCSSSADSPAQPMSDDFTYAPRQPNQHFDPDMTDLGHTPTATAYTSQVAAGAYSVHATTNIWPPFLTEQQEYASAAGGNWWTFGTVSHPQQHLDPLHAHAHPEHAYDGAGHDHGQQQQF